MKFKGSSSLLNALVRFSVIFSHVAYCTMAAEAPDHHRGDLGRLEEVRNGLIGVDTFGH